MEKDKVLFRSLSYKITGLLFQAHTELGHSRNEKQYADYFEKLLILEKIVFIREFRFDIYNKTKKARCVCDFIVEDKIILEFKAKNFLTKNDYYQIKRYLNTLNLELGILVNFRQYRLAPKRILNANLKTFG